MTNPIYNPRKRTVAEDKETEQPKKRKRHPLSVGVGPPPLRGRSALSVGVEPPSRRREVTKETTTDEGEIPKKRRRHPLAVGSVNPRRRKRKEKAPKWKELKRNLEARTPGFGMNRADFKKSLKKHVKAAGIPISEWNDMAPAERESVFRELVKTQPSIRTSKGFKKAATVSSNPEELTVKLFKRSLAFGADLEFSGSD